MTGLRTRLRQARHHSGALAIIAVFYLPPLIYALAPLSRLL